MKKNQPRVLAYELAQVVPDDLLQQVSGGCSGFVHKRTYTVSGPTQELDFVFDVDNK